MPDETYPQRQPLNANEWARRMAALLDQLAAAEDQIREARRDIQLMLMQFVVNPAGGTATGNEEENK